MWNVDKGLWGLHKLFETFLFSPLSTHCVKPYIFTGCSQEGKVTFGNTLCTFNMKQLGITVYFTGVSIYMKSVLDDLWSSFVDMHFFADNVQALLVSSKENISINVALFHAYISLGSVLK